MRHKPLGSSLLAFGLLLAAASSALAEPQKGTIRMRDGRVLEDVLYEIRGQKVWVKRPYGEVTYDMAKIKAIEPNEDEGPDVGEAEIDRPGADWLARFQLEPPQDWEVSKPTQPAVLAQMRHKSRKAKLMVRVFPIDKPFSYEKGSERDAGSRMDADMKVMFERISGSRVALAELHGNPVYHLSGATVREHGRERDYPDMVVEELRFQRLGLEYALTYMVAKEDEGALAPDLKRVFESFSFLPALVIEDALYADLTRGFALAMLPEYKATVRPFDEKNPLSLQSADGRATVEVEVLVGRDAERMVRDRISKRGETSKLEVEPASLNGTEVVRFSFNGFKKGGRNLLGFRGYAAATESQVVILTGVMPLSDQDSKKLVKEVDSILASFRARNVDALTKSARRAKAAFELLAQGSEALGRRRNSEAVQRLSEAIETEPDFALAYYLRALARKNSNDFEGYREDLTKAGSLAPGEGFDAALAGALADEALAVHKKKQWEESITLHGKLLANKTNEEDSRKYLLEAVKGLYGQMKRAKNYRQWKTIEDDLWAFRDDVEVMVAMSRTLQDCAKDLAGLGKVSEAKRCLRGAKKAVRQLKGDKNYKKYEADYDRAQKAVDKARKR